MRGILAAVLASVIWGLSPIFYAQLNHVPPLELLAHRVSWGFLVVGLYCAATGRLPRVAEALGNARTLAALVVSAALISLNWFGFLWGIQAGRAMEAGLGYYIMPLVAVALGVAFLGERLSRRQWLAVSLALVAVAVLAIGLGRAPWLALGLAVSFALYGLVRRQVSTGPIVGFFVETVLIVPAAVVWIWGVETQGWTGPTGREGALFGTDWKTTALLVLSGPLTSVPLILFAEAARSMPLSRVGLVQYINPSLQVAVAGLVLGEMFTPWHGVALVLIWAGLGLFSSEIFRQERASRSASISSSTVSKTLR